jgi:hypothetical protein
MDVKAAYPAIKGLDLDFERLSLYCQTRGLSLFTLDLPNLDAILLKGLEVGRLTLEGPLSRGVSSKVRVPRLFSGLWLRVFDREACLKQDVDATAVFFLRQLSVIGKKIRVECSDDRIIAALENYHGIERTLRPPVLDWSSDKFVVESRASVLSLGDAAFCSYTHSPIFGGKANRKDCQTVEEEEAWDEEYKLRRLLNKVQLVADLVLSAFEPFDPVTSSEARESAGMGTGFRHGPGAVAERNGFSEKSEFPNWPAKLQRTFPFEMVGKTANSDQPRPRNHEVASRLICVPKDAKRPRIIAAEPIAHQYCQQKLLSYMSGQFRRLFGGDFIDLRAQDKSGRMVLKASLDQSLATVDLSDASDRLTCWTVERIMRKNPSLLKALHAARTRYLKDAVSKVPSFLSLRKFASQGSATTFPVQSIVFLCIALGVSIKGRVNWGNIQRLRTQVRVFGDDIIIPSHGYEDLVRIMDALQLKVNMAKSYVHGHFRESCGTDGFMGLDVTPTKPQRLDPDTPSACQALVDTANNLHMKGLWYAADAVLALLPARVRNSLRVVQITHNDGLKVPEGFAGLKSFVGNYEEHLFRRWNRNLHRYEVRVWTTLSKPDKRYRDGYPALLDFFSRGHSHERAREVSVSQVAGKTKQRLAWEPLNTDGVGW